VLGTIMIGAAGRPLPAGAQTASPGQVIAQAALQYVGVPYTSTGTRPSTGFSDIGFVRYVYRGQGIRLHISVTHSAYDRMLADGPLIDMADLQPGDILIFQNTIWPGLSHAAIYLGNGTFVHAEWYGSGVKISSLRNDPKDGNYWSAHYVTAVRPWAAT
jgi:cell wall-associated NlpC family hydrolase